MPGKFDDNIYKTYPTGRHLKITKKKVEWGMLYNNQEHVVMLKQSIVTGKKQIYLDKRVIFEDSKMLEIQFSQEVTFDGMRVVVSCEIKDKEIVHHLTVNEQRYETLPFLNRAQVANAQRYNKKIIPACLLYDIPPGENISMFEASKTDQAVERAKAYLEDSSSDEDEESSSSDDDESSSDEDDKKKKKKSKKSSNKKKTIKKKKSKKDDSSSSSDDDSSSEDSSDDESSKKKKQLAKKKQLIAQRKKSMPASILQQRKKTMPATVKPRAKSTVKKVTWAEDIGDDDDDEEEEEDYVVTIINKKKVKVPLKHSKYISRSSGEEDSSDEDEDLPRNRKPIKKMTKNNIPKAPALNEKAAAQDDFDDLFA